MRFDLTDLRLFLAVVEAGSLTAGAARANMALASASERVRAMEAFAETPLLERLHRGVALTPAGRALADHAREIVDAHDRMRGDLAKFGRGLKGLVRIMANSSAISEHLPGPLASFLAANAHIDVDLEEGASHEVLEAVAAGRAEFGVASDKVDPGPLARRHFRRDALVLVCNGMHPLASLTHISFAQALAFEHVGLRPGAALSDYLAGQARRLGLPIAFRVRVGSFGAVCRMAEQGVGVGIVPVSAARRARRSMTIRPIPLSDVWAMRDLIIATHPARALSIHASALLDWLAEDADQDKERPGSVAAQGPPVSSLTRARAP